MSEKFRAPGIPTNPNESSPQEAEQAERDILEWYLSTHQVEVEPVRNQTEILVEIERLEALFVDFETRFPLDSLNAIHTRAEAETSILREDAKAAFKPVHVLFTEIQARDDITTEQKIAIKEHRNKISLAIGFINAGKLRHTRD